MAERARTLYGTTNDSGSVPPARAIADENSAAASAPFTTLAPEASFDSLESPIACAGVAGPVYTDDGRLVLSESFDDFAPIWNESVLEDDMNALISGDDYIESWRIWDCYEEDWADFELTVFRFENYDLAIRHSSAGICAWRGAIDTRGRVIASPNPEDYEQKCWQWQRESRCRAFASFNG